MKAKLDLRIASTRQQGPEQPRQKNSIRQNKFQPRGLKFEILKTSSYRI